jgi:hypothetical protein
MTIASRKAFRDACARGDLPAASRSLLAWARLAEPGLRNLGDLARLLDDPDQTSAIGDLQRACYGTDVVTGCAKMLSQAFAHGPVFARPVAPAHGRNGALPELYPFRL